MELIQLILVYFGYSRFIFKIITLYNIHSISLPAAVIGVLFYKEIQGLKNYIILTIVFILAFTGSILVAFSKIG